MKLLYVSGPYRSHLGLRGIHKNIEAASDAAFELWQMGAAVICPHKNTAYFDTASDHSDCETWLRGDLEMVRRCDAMVMVGEWMNSRGAQMEWGLARELNQPIFIWPEERDKIAKYLSK